MNVPVHDPHVRGASVMLTVPHQFDLLRNSLLEAVRLELRLKAEYKRAQDELITAQFNMREYLKDQGAL